MHDLAVQKQALDLPIQIFHGLTCDARSSLLWKIFFQNSSLFGIVSDTSVC